MVTAHMPKQTIAHTFEDTEGVLHEVANIHSISRSDKNSFVTLLVDGELVTVAITSNTATNIFELLN